MNNTDVKPARTPRRKVTAPEQSAPAAPQGTKRPTKLDQVQALLLAPAGATIAELMDATGWEQHSVRGAIAGALKKRGLSVASDKIDGIRRYRASMAA